MNQEGFYGPSHPNGEHGITSCVLLKLIRLGWSVDPGLQTVIP